MDLHTQPYPPALLAVARIGWLGVVVPLVGLLVVGVPGFYTRLSVLADGTTLLPADTLRVGLQVLGVPNAAYAVVHLTRLLVVSLGFIAVGAVIWRRAADVFALIVSLLLVVFGVLLTLPATMELQGPPPPWLTFLASSAFVSIFLVSYVFPDGRFVPGWTRPLVLVWLALVLGVSFFPGSALDVNAWPSVVNVPLNLALLATCPAALILRYRHAGAGQRQQLKWVVFGITAALLGFFAFWSGAREVPALREPGASAALYDLMGGTVLLGGFLLIPLTIGFAVLRYRLWDVDPIVNRALVYGALTASVITTYVVVVGYIGGVFQGQYSSFLSLLAAAVVALLFQPVRQRLQRGVNRLMYGHRDEPYAVISQLSQRLESSLAPDAALETIVETVRNVLKLPYVAIAVQNGDRYVTAAAAGSAGANLVELALVFQGEQVGQLVLTPRASDEPLGPRDRQLLGELARQSGPTVHAFRLARDLKALTAEVQQARTRIVTAREEERQRLQRDLHDGIGSALVSLSLRAGAIRNLLDRDSGSADRLLQEQQSTIREAVADIRRLVHDLRPAALDELGLAGAVRKLAGQHAAASRVHVNVELPASLPSLPAAVEVAAFRITQEALSNVERHARANRCRITMSVLGENVHLEVADDGHGLNDSTRPGVGMRSMRDRAEELGGSFTVDRAPEGGARVAAVLPIGG